MKELCDMTLDELWQLFPIVLTEHNPQWAEWYDSEVAALKSMLPPEAVYYHIGSTAIAGIWAKPIVDIIVAVPSRQVMNEVARILSGNGYIVMSQTERRISLNKGYTKHGFAERVFHLHIRLSNDIDEVYFRDYLNAHADVAKQYEQLKLALWKQFEHDRDSYTLAKTEFVNKYTELGKKELGVRK